MRSLGSDFRYGLRTLLRTPGFTAVAMLTLGLGIGANAAIFSVVQSVLLSPLPFPEPDRLVQMWESREQRGWTSATFTHANFWDVRDRARAVVAAAAYGGGSANLTGLDQPRRVNLGRVSADFFRVLGVDATVGRTFAPGEDEPGRDHALVVLSHRFWISVFGGDPGVVGRSLMLNDQSHVVLGVAPQGRPWLDNVDAFVLLPRDPDADRSSFELQVIGRLAPGVSTERAGAELAEIARQLAREHPVENEGMGIPVTPSSAWVASDSLRRSLWILMGAVGLLLLIACANLANLLLARATGRARERALRAALGASRAQIARQLLTESLLVSTGGALLGLALAAGIIRLLRGLDLAGIPRLADASIDGGVLLFTIVATVLTGLGTGLFPARHAAREDVATALRDGDRGQVGGRAGGTLRGGLVAAEVAASLALLVGAGLLLRSFAAVLGVDRGFATEDRVVAEVALPGRYDGERTSRFLSELMASLEATPGVSSAAAVSLRPLLGVGPGMGFAGADRPAPADNEVPWAGWRIVTGGYFETLGVPLLRGRDFTEQDQLGNPWRVIVSRRLAEQVWPGQDPVGRTLILWKGQGDSPAEVIGVAGDMRDWELTEQPSLTVYLPYYGARTSSIHVVVHSPAGLAPVEARLRSLLAELDPDLPVSWVEDLEGRVSQSVASRRFLMLLLVAFAGVALVMAIAGVFGVLSYAVSRRTAEIGVRVALGASRGTVLRMIVRQGMRPVVVGLVVGVGLALAGSRLMTAMLFGVGPADVATYVAVAALLFGTAVAACWLPARQALRVDVVQALRRE